MRLQETYFICRSACANWQEPVLTDHKQQNTNVTFYNLTNFEQIAPVLDMLSPIDSLHESIKKVYECIPYQGTKNPVAGTLGAKYSFSSAERNVFLQVLADLHSKVKTIEETLAAAYKDREIGVDIKMPPNMTLFEMSKYIRDLDLVFSQNPIFKIEDTSIQLSSVDRGSIWLNIIIGGTGAMILLERLVKLVDNILIARSHHLTNQEQLLRIKTLKQKHDLAETMRAGFEELFLAELNEVTDNLAADCGVTDPEERQRLHESVTRLNNLYAKGIEIYEAITPGVVTPVFPPVEKQQLSAEQIKLLTEGDNTTDK